MPLLRPLEPSDHDALRRLYLEAPVEDRCTRFCAKVSDAAVLRHLDHAVTKAEALVGAFEGGGLVGVAEVFLGHGAAELAFLVAHDAQRQGVGKALMAEALAAATRLGASKALVITARDNRPMHRLALSAGMRRRVMEDDDWTAEIALPAT